MRRKLEFAVTKRHTHEFSRLRFTTFEHFCSFHRDKALLFEILNNRVEIALDSALYNKSSSTFEEETSNALSVNNCNTLVTHMIMCRSVYVVLQCNYEIGERKW
jgi:hypothetical protein